MKNVPHWQLLVGMYLVIVAFPVYYVHTKLRARAYANKNFTNLFIYFIGLIGTAVLLHSACMWLYFTFFFGVRS
jgi:hypothetical protein